MIIGGIATAGFIAWWAWMLMQIESGWVERAALWIISIGLISLYSFYIGETVVSHAL